MNANTHHESRPQQSRRDALRALGALSLSAPGLSAFAQERVAMRAAPLAAGPLVTPIRLARRASAAALALEDYSAEFTKRELLNGEMITARMLLKIRHRPFSVYLKAISPNEGREVLYVAGKNGGNLRVHSTGLAAIMGTVSVRPDSSLALRESKHPLTEIGMANLATKVADAWADESDASVQYFPSATLAGRPVRVIETVSRRSESARVRLTLDAANGLPVRVQRADRGANGQFAVVEDYAYLHVATNLGLTDIDFDERNPAYQF